MSKTYGEVVRLAVGFIKQFARPLEQGLYRFHFEKGSADDVREVLGGVSK